ncbi:hypothetical protein T492DRAFT_960672 [Pavlovales sp. CCMP2436]|nr:hypothetical protein T492DRAFT_960672 [Pavlovales sp. CCMP2436]
MLPRLILLVASLGLVTKPIGRALLPTSSAPAAPRLGRALRSSTAPTDVTTTVTTPSPYFSPKAPEPPEDEKRRQRDFRLNVGKVIDTLQADYPVLFEEAPDFSIFEPGIELTDPSGVSIRGINMYRPCFSLLRLARYAMASVEMKSKVCYAAGWDPYKVRVRWNLSFSTMLSPGRTYFVDGVSAYTLSDSGLVKLHELQNVIINGREVEQPFLQWFNPLNPRGAVAILGGLSFTPRVELPAPPDIFFQKSEPAEPAAPAEREVEAKAAAKEREKPRPLFQPNSMFDVCETSYDCDYPMICCDLLLAKVCCSNGAFAPVQRNIPIPIPIPRDDIPGW